MAGQKVYSDIDQFIGEVKKQGIVKLACAVTSEKRAEQVSDEKLEVVFKRKAEVLAYKNAVIYKCVLENMDEEALLGTLESQGFEVSRSSRNIT